MAVCSFMGLPWYVAATVISIAHIDSLKMESESSAPGEQPQFLGVRWDFAVWGVFYCESVDSAVIYYCLCSGSRGWQVFWCLCWLDCLSSSLQCFRLVDATATVCVQQYISHILYPTHVHLNYNLLTNFSFNYFYCTRQKVLVIALFFLFIKMNLIVFVSVHPNASPLWCVPLHGSGFTKWHSGNRHFLLLKSSTSVFLLLLLLIYLYSGYMFWLLVPLLSINNPARALFVLTSTV